MHQWHLIKLTVLGSNVYDCPFGPNYAGHHLVYSHCSTAGHGPIWKYGKSPEWNGAKVQQICSNIMVRFRSSLLSKRWCVVSLAVVRPCNHSYVMISPVMFCRHWDCIIKGGVSAIGFYGSSLCSSLSPVLSCWCVAPLCEDMQFGDCCCMLLLIHHKTSNLLDLTYLHICVMLNCLSPSDHVLQA